MMTLEFYDSEDVFGRIETEEDPDRIRALLMAYKQANIEDYNIDDFFEYLRNKNVDFTTINIEADVKLYF